MTRHAVAMDPIPIDGAASSPWRSEHGHRHRISGSVAWGTPRRAAVAVRHAAVRRRGGAGRAALGAGGDGRARACHADPAGAAEPVARAGPRRRLVRRRGAGDRRTGDPAGLACRAAVRGARHKSSGRSSRSAWRCCWRPSPCCGDHRWPPSSQPGWRSPCNPSSAMPGHWVAPRVRCWPAPRRCTCWQPVPGSADCCLCWSASPASRHRKPSRPASGSPRSGCYRSG